jgi:diaminopimelate epimerase
MQFHKYQALGNDFIVIRESELKTVTTNYGEFAKRICDRHFGAGADGMEVVLDRKTVDEADYEIRLYNADGGETPISGNGTRCVAAYLYVAERWLKPKVRIATAAGVKNLTLIDREGGYCEFRMEVGTPKFASPEIPVNFDPPLAQVIRQKLHVDGQDIEFTATSMGNPHCSILVDDFDTLDWRKLGAAIETHAAFPDRTNVEFVRVVNRDEIEVRFWERGVGETLASGTGACGAALAAMLNGLVERKVQVKTVRGAMAVEWRSDDVVTQTGEARAVFSGEWIR